MIWRTVEISRLASRWRESHLAPMAARQPVLVLTGCLLVVGILGCGATPLDPAQPPEHPQPPFLWVLVAPDGATLNLSDSLKMSVSSNAPKEWGPMTVEWATSDTMVAVVSPSGWVRPRASGTVGVRARLMNERVMLTGLATVHIQ